MQPKSPETGGSGSASPSGGIRGSFSRQRSDELHKAHLEVSPESIDDFTDLLRDSPGPDLAEAVKAFEQQADQPLAQDGMQVLPLS